MQAPRHQCCDVLQFNLEAAMAQLEHSGFGARSLPRRPINDVANTCRHHDTNVATCCNSTSKQPWPNWNTAVLAPGRFREGRLMTSQTHAGTTTPTLRRAAIQSRSSHGPIGTQRFWRQVASEKAD